MTRLKGTFRTVGFGVGSSLKSSATTSLYQSPGQGREPASPQSPAGTCSTRHSDRLVLPANFHACTLAWLSLGLLGEAHRCLPMGLVLVSAQHQPAKAFWNQIFSHPKTKKQHGKALRNQQATSSPCTSSKEGTSHRRGPAKGAPGLQNPNTIVGGTKVGLDVPLLLLQGP